MKKVKTVFLLIIPVLVVITGCLIFMKLQDQTIKESKTYQLYAKLDSLILFSFEDADNPLITNYEFQSEEDKSLFSEVNFTGISLKEAIDKYLEVEKKRGLTLTKVYLWTNWDNQNYFEGDNYKLNIVDDKTLNNVPEETKPQLLYNQAYYKVGDKHNYNMVIKDNWSLEYHIDEYTDTFCDEYMDNSCFDATINDEYYEYAESVNTYSLSENKITLKARENESYFGWVYAYDECEIMYNALKCDYYNSNHTTTPVYQTTTYYEIR